MVGGIIVEVRTIHSRKVWINVEERPLTGSHKPGRCAIYVNPACVDLLVRANIQRGDSLWWQGEYAMWTPNGLTDKERHALKVPLVDVRLRRIGFSGVSTPEHRA